MEVRSINCTIQATGGHLMNDVNRSVHTTWNCRYHTAVGHEPRRRCSAERDAERRKKSIAVERKKYPFIRLLRGGVLLHAGAVCTDAGGIGLLAPSGIGKSTITAGMLAFCGAKLISDDILTLCFDEGSGDVLALPSSTHLAMRHGMFDHDGFVEKTDTTEYKHLLMVNPQQCAQKPCILCALVIVHHSQEISLRKLSFAEALPHILSQQLSMSNAPEAFRRQQFRAITGWLSGISCYILEMSCNTRQEAEAGIGLLKQLAISN